MKKFINKKLKENQETEVGEKIEDINIVGIVAKKKENKKPKGLDELLNYLKLKAKSAFVIATIMANTISFLLVSEISISYLSPIEKNFLLILPI